MDTQDLTIYLDWIHLFFLPPMPEKRKTIWSELESNPDPLASQATAVTTRPLRLGHLLFDELFCLSTNNPFIEMLILLKLHRIPSFILVLSELTRSKF